MSDNTCNNCMLLKKGDCFGKNEICEDFRYSPSMSSSDKDSWPTIMRSNRHSVHLEYKKEQEIRAQLNKEKKPEPVVRVKEVTVSPSNKILVQVKPIFVKETIKKGAWNQKDLEERYSQGVFLFLNIKKGKNLCNYEYILQYKGTSKKYSGYSFCQSYNAVYLDAISDAISRMNRPIEVYIINNLDNRLDKIVDVNSYEVEEMQNNIKTLLESKNCMIFELVFDSVPNFF